MFAECNELHLHAFSSVMYNVYWWNPAVCIPLLKNELFYSHNFFSSYLQEWRSYSHSYSSHPAAQSVRDSPSKTSSLMWTWALMRRLVASAVPTSGKLPSLGAQILMVLVLAFWNHRSFSQMRSLEWMWFSVRWPSCREWAHSWICWIVVWLVLIFHISVSWWKRGIPLLLISSYQDHQRSYANRSHAGVRFACNISLCYSDYEEDWRRLCIC